MPLLADATATIAAWAAAAIVLLLLAGVLWSFLRRRGTVEGLVAESPADAARRARLEEEAVGDVPRPTDPGAAS